MTGEVEKFRRMLSDKVDLIRLEVICCKSEHDEVFMRLLTHAEDIAEEFETLLPLLTLTNVWQVSQVEEQR